MKKFLSIFTVLLLSFGFTSCNDDDEGDGIIDMIVEEVHFTASGGKTHLDPNASGSLKVAADQEWIEARVEKGKVMLKVPQFFSGISRSGSIEITTKTSSKVIKILQLPHTLKVDGDKEIFASLFKGGEYKIPIKSTFPNEPSRLRAILKDEADKSWIDAVFISNSELTVKVAPNPSKKQKKSVLYLAAEGDVELTIMDSITVNSAYMAEDFIGKWTATFSNRENKVFSEEVEMIMDESGNINLKGLSVYEDSEVLIDIPIAVVGGALVLKIGSYFPIMKEADGRYIYILAIIDSFAMWGPGGGPQSFTGYIDEDADTDIICKFSPFRYSSYNVTGMALRAYSASSYPSSSNSLGITRYINNLELTMSR